MIRRSRLVRLRPVVVLTFGLGACLRTGALEDESAETTSATTQTDSVDPSAGASTSSQTSGAGTGSTGTMGMMGTTGVDASTGYSFIPDDTDDINDWLECSVWDQDCPPGEKCMPWANDGGNAWNGTKCSPVAPDPRQPGESCTVVGSRVSGVDDCDHASMCWDVESDTLMGTCRAFCTGSEAHPVCENPDEQCSVNAGGELILCFPTCDPLLQDCPEGEGCYGLDDTLFICAWDGSEDGGAAGEPCDAVNACDPGLSCTSTELLPGCPRGRCCSPFCALDDPDPPCEPLQECVSWYDEGEVHPDWFNVGVCGMPR